MSPPVFFLLLAAGTLLFGLLLGWTARRLARAGGQRGMLGRKLFHAGVFTGAVPAQLWLGFWGVVLYGSILAALVGWAYLRGERAFLYQGLIRRGDRDGKAEDLLFPLAATAVGGLMGVLFVGSFAMVGYLVCGWGDAWGEVVGRRWGTRTYRSPLVRPGGAVRTVEGSLGVLGGGILGGWAALGVLGYPAVPALTLGLVAGGVGALAEGLTPGKMDNLWVQLLPSLAVWWFLG